MCASQMTVRCSFCSASHEQDEIWQRWKNERTEENWSEMEKANGAVWRESLVSWNWRRRCQFMCKSHDSRNLCRSLSNGSIFAHCQARSCARQKFDKTDTEQCLGIGELGRLVWHSVANGGPGIEVDEEGLSRRRRSGTPICH